MSGHQNIRHLEDEAECEIEDSVAGNDGNGEGDVYAQLAQKERDLILAAELGKALLDSNQELQSRYDQSVEEFTRQVEELQQEKHDLHLELEKMETEYQNAIKDLQEDVTVLRKQVRDSDEQQITEKERSRSLREAQQNTDYLMEQIKKSSAREEELLQELGQEKIKNDSSTATIQDQVDHITMLREQVEYLSEKLRETNQKLLEVQVEKESLVNTLEVTQEKMNSLELQVSQQNEKIHRQACDIEELQESNSELQQQLRQRQSSQYHYPPQLRPQLFFNRNNNNSNNNNNCFNGSNNHSAQPQNLFSELCQEKQKESNPQLQAHHISSDDKQCIQNAHQEQSSYEETDGACVQGLDISSSKGINEESLGAELAKEGHNLLSSDPLSSLKADVSVVHRHRRNISDCSISSLTEGSRKRHHQNIGGSSDDEDENMNICTDSNGNQLSSTESSQIKNPSPYKRDRNELSDRAESINFMPLSHDQPLFSEPLSYQAGYIHHSISQESSPFPSLESELKATASGGDKSIMSELSPYAHEFYPRHHEVQEQSLFSELSSQLNEDRNGSGSDSSSNCILGVFDFHSGSESQDGDNPSNESLNHSMEMRSRHESDMSYVTDWYYMTPVTTDMLEEDDFECDDDDFLVGNMAGTTLSISDDHASQHYYYSSHNPAAEMSSSDNDVFTSENVDELSVAQASGDLNQDKHQTQLNEACRQLKELVGKVSGEKPVESKIPETGETSTEVLLSLIAELRLCVDKLTSTKDQQIQSSDVSTTANDSSAKTMTGTDAASPQQKAKNQLSPVVEDKPMEIAKDTGEEAGKQMRKSKSSSSLPLRKF